MSWDKAYIQCLMILYSIRIQRDKFSTFTFSPSVETRARILHQNSWEVQCTNLSFKFLIGQSNKFSDSIFPKMALGSPLSSILDLNLNENIKKNHQDTDGYHSTFLKILTVGKFSVPTYLWQLPLIPYFHKMALGSSLLSFLNLNLQRTL